MPLINFSGIASGLDTEGLIKAQTDARRQTQIKPNQDKVTELTDENDKLEELKTNIRELQTMLQGLSTLSGGAVSKEALSTDETIVSASARQGTASGNYTINVTSKAQNGIYTVEGSWASLSTPVDATIDNLQPAVDRTLTYTIGTGGDQETIGLELTNTTTIGDVIASFNSRSENAVMSAVNVGTAASPSYKLVVTSLNEGTATGSISTSVGAHLATLSVLDPLAATEQPATNAVFDITGVGTGITRSSNTITDVISGVTLRITDTGSASVRIGDDVAQTTNNVQDFIDKWNEIVKFVADNNLIVREQDSSSNATNVFGPLSRSRVDDNALTALRSALSGNVAENGSAVRVLADLGITTERDGTLKFDTEVFETALSTESFSVNTLIVQLADDLSLTGGVIDLQVGFNRAFDLSINSNKDAINDLNDRIAEIEKRIAAEETALRARYSQLERNIGRLQSQQGTLSSALARL